MKTPAQTRLILSILAPIGSFFPLLALGAPTPFHQQGTVDPANVTVESVEGETTRRSEFWHSQPVLARDPDGSFYIGNKHTLTKLNPEGVPQWKLTLQRSDTQSPEPGISAEHWGHQILDTEAGLTDYNAWNINQVHESTFGGEDVINDLDVIDIQVTEDYLILVGRVVSGNGPRVYLARFSREGQFVWRQVTSVGSSGARIGRDYVNVLVDESNDVIHVTESGENHTYLSGGQYFTTAMPASQIVQIALSDGTRGAPFTFGYNGSNPSQEKNHRIIKALLLNNGMLIWHARTSDDFVAQGTYQDYDKDTIELFDPETLSVMHSATISRTFGTPFEPGHVQSSVADIALSGGTSLLILVNASEQFAESPTIRHNLNVISLDFSTLSFNQQWDYSPAGEDFADRMVVQFGRLTLIGNAPSGSGRGGWQLSQHELNGASLPVFNWKRDTPYDSPYFLDPTTNFNRFHDMQIDGSGNIYVTATFGEDAPNFTIVLDPSLFYVKYSSSGHLQFFRPLPGFHLPITQDLDFPLSAAPGQLLLAPDAPGGSTAPSFHLFGLATSVETATTMQEASTKKWNLLYLEQENNVAADPMTFLNPIPNFEGGTLEGDSILRTDNSDPSNRGRLSFSFSTNGVPYRVWIDSTLPAGVFHSDTWNEGDNTVFGFLNGPITAPFGDYTFVLNASNAHETISKTYTIRHGTAAPVDSLRPGLTLTGPKGASSRAPSTKVSGVAVDDVAVATVSYRYKVGKKPYSRALSARLTPGTVLRKFTVSIPSRVKGPYLVEFTVRDGSGKQTIKKVTFNRR